MTLGNQTLLKEFIFVGFSKSQEMCILFFIILLPLYILTLLGNSFLICTVAVSPKLHTPMYWFLCNLSFLDLCFSSSSVPKILFDLFSKNKTISLTACLAQMNMGLFLGGLECILLAVMAYDRYIAICLPLYYTNFMKWTICRNIIIIMWIGSFILTIFPTITKPLVFCKGNKINHFSCDILALLELACKNIDFYKIILFVETLFVLVTPFLFIVGSYVCIIVSILKIPSTKRKRKAFSTCTSHLTVVFMFYGQVWPCIWDK